MSVMDWLLFTFFTAFALFSTWVFGSALAEAAARWLLKGERPVYRRWGVEDEIFVIVSNWRFAVLFPIVVLGCAYMSYLFVISVQFVFGESTTVDFQSDPFNRVVSILMMTLIVGLFWRMYKIDLARSKAARLERLPAYFQESLGIPGLVATYDSLVYAPRMFWDAFSELGNGELTFESSRRFQELGGQYRAIQGLSYVRLGIAVGVFAALIPVLLFLFQLSKDAYVP